MGKGCKKIVLPAITNAFAVARTTSRKNAIHHIQSNLFSSMMMIFYYHKRSTRETIGGKWCK